MVTSSAASGSVVGHATLTVTAAIVNTIAITPGATTIVKGHTLQFTAQATMTDGTKQDISATAVWLSETTGTAAISTMGLATGVAAGTSRISASSGGVTSNHVTLTVTN